MKWMLVPFLLHFCIFRPAQAAEPSQGKVITYPFGTPTNLTSQAAIMNALFEKQLLKHIPNEHPFIVKNLTTFVGAHVMESNFDCLILLPEFRSTNQQESLQMASKYLQGYVDALNNTREMRPYFCEFPVPVERCDFALGFATDPFTNLAYPKPYLASSLFIGPQKQVEIRQLAETQTSYSPYVNIYKGEYGTFSELTKEINTPRLDKTDDLQPIPLIEEKRFCAICKEQKPEFLFAQRFAQNNQLTLLAYRYVFSHEKPRDLKIFSSIAYAAQERFMTIDDAKALVSKACKEQIEFLRTSGKLAHVVHIHRAAGREALSPTIDAQTYIGLRISFWDKYLDRVKTPNIAEIQVYGKRARYYVADELQRLQLVLEEELPNHDIDIPVPKNLST